MTAKPKSRNETFHEAIYLLEFATDMIDEGPVLGNVYEGLPSVWRNKGEAERMAAAVEMRNGLGALLDIFHKPGHLRTLREALERAS